VTNPCPRVKHPDWLRKIVREINDGYRQTKIDQLFKAAPAGARQVFCKNSSSTAVAFAVPFAAARFHASHDYRVWRFETTTFGSN